MNGTLTSDPPQQEYEMFLVFMYDPVKYFYEAVLLVVSGEKRKMLYSKGLDMKEDTLPMQEQGIVLDYLGLSIRATDHLTCLPTGHLSFWKNKTPGYHSTTEHDLGSWRDSY